jgi:hypothetical protein
MGGPGVVSSSDVIDRRSWRLKFKIVNILEAKIGPKLADSVCNMIACCRSAG